MEREATQDETEWKGYVNPGTRQVNKETILDLPAHLVNLWEDSRSNHYPSATTCEKLQARQLS
jgi:hypothetical protein